MLLIPYMCKRERDLQSLIHADKCRFGLVKESKYDTLREVALILVVIHLEYLLEGRNVDAVAEV